MKNFVRSSYYDSIYNEEIKYEIPEASMKVSLVFKENICAIIKITLSNEGIVQLLSRDIKENQDYISVTPTTWLTYQVRGDTIYPIIWDTSLTKGIYTMVGTLHEP
ncbi:hypothetical protein H9Q13_05275 [Pontibacter sp. JH31]|uniref:Uncharacterized protein n=1 Tax=Pontibacter aquaedesilientis TaxID=2766980 RepID=A0ABR7XE58_9BACT|nr:hypothetical protein [Pontibacter aquaedesilientis]MBD1396569.1 hypothetical protein [Pontibacter aquaedesilientis]